MAGDGLSHGEDDQSKKKRSSSPSKSSTHTGAPSESSHQSPATAPIHQKRPIGGGSMAGSKLSHGSDGRSMKKQKPTPIPRPRTQGDGRSCVPTAVAKVHDDGRIFRPDMNYGERSHDFCKVLIRRPSSPPSNKLQSLSPEKELRHGPDASHATDVGVLGRAAAEEPQHGVSSSAEETLKNWKDLRANNKEVPHRPGNVEDKIGDVVDMVVVKRGGDMRDFSIFHLGQRGDARDFKDNTNGSKTNGILFDEGVIGAINNRQMIKKVDIEGMQCSTNFPFDKSFPLWSEIEEMPVFKVIPQQPHFKPLQHENCGLREGRAFGLMVSFVTIVKKLNNSTIDDSEESFQEMKTTLSELEANGFSVQPLQSFLDRKIVAKQKYTEDLQQSCTFEEEMQAKKSSLSQNESLLTEIEKKISDYEEVLGKIRHQGQRIEKVITKDENEISRLQSVHSSIKEALDYYKQQFHSVSEDMQQMGLI